MAGAEQGRACDWPVIAGMGLCCGDTPCSVEWRRPCDDEGGCLDRSTCAGCDEPVFKQDRAAVAEAFDIDREVGNLIDHFDTAPNCEDGRRERIKGCLTGLLGRYSAAIATRAAAPAEGQR